VPTIGFVGSLVAVRPRAPGLPHSSNAYASMGGSKAVRSQSSIWAAGRRERFTEIAAEFARLKVDVIVTAGTDAVIAAKKATSVAQLVRQKESRPRAAPCLLSEGSSVVIGVSDRVLHVAGDIMRGALRLVDFAFRLQLLIAGYLAG
jgi:hypothetical protein